MTGIGTTGAAMRGLEAHGFVALRDHRFPPDVATYEFGNHACVDGVADFLRLNVYASRDGGFVTVWSGLLEPIATEARLVAAGLSAASPWIVAAGGMDALLAGYGEGLFRGWPTDDADLAVVLRCLRLGPSGPYARPQRLRAGDGSFACVAVD